MQPQKVTTYMAAQRKMLQAFATVFAKRSYVLLAMAGGAASFALPILIPVWLVPSNTLSFELSLMRPENYAVLSLLAAASGMLVAFNVFLLRKRRESMVAAGGASVSTIAALVGGVITTSCGCGIGLLLGFVGLGAGSTSFVIGNQLYITLFALLIVSVGLYLNVRAVAGVCAACEVVAPDVL